MQNKTFNQTITVTEQQTAAYLGSGELAVFATPAMIAFMENTAMKMIEQNEGDTSVGISITTNHVKASPVGSILHCEATIISIEGRKYSFAIRVTDEQNNLLGEGTHERVVVNREKFMSKI